MKFTYDCFEIEIKAKIKGAKSKEEKWTELFDQLEATGYFKR